MKKNKFTFKLPFIALAVLLNLASNAQELKENSTEEKQANDKTEKTDDAYNQRMLIVGQRKELNTEAGSVTTIDEEQLEKFSYDDIHRILAQVPGINIRQEDGYGLRPNIGFRGVTPERSKKINILEDGVLIGPAPYSAPAAYYFPMINKITSIEVFKGPAAILYGPNTVAGTLNLQTRPVPSDDEGMIDFSIGDDGFQKAHGYASKTSGDFGFLIEGITLQSDGFKELDNGNDTGFDKKDITAKLRYNLDGNEFQQVFELKIGYADELSDETYLGLSDTDFAANPYQRYAASQLDQMNWEHHQYQFNHFLAGDNFDLTTRIYQNEFERAWRKLNNFRPTNNPATQRSLQEILREPDAGISSILYQVLTGTKDSEGLFEQLLIGINDRSYISRGIQTDFRWQGDWLGLSHNLRTGLRYHQDHINRFHTEDAFNMIAQQLINTGDVTDIVTANTERSRVISWYAQDTLSLDKWEVTLGIRGEFIDSYYQNNALGQEQDWLKKQTEVWLPGASAFYSINKQSGVFFGIHRGFVPTSPKQEPEIEIEESTNFELGYRYFNQTTRFELVGFLSDFKNLKESCTASTSTTCFSIIDQEFSAGEVKVSGLEASASGRYGLTNGIDIPLSLVYTYTQAEFQETFESDFALWGDVTAGNDIPYLPSNQLTLSAGLETVNWRANLLARFTSSMQEAAGSGVPLSGVETDELWVLDFSAAYDFNEFGSLYFKIDNLLNEAKIVSRRPFGARPNKPRQAYIGYRYAW